MSNKLDTVDYVWEIACPIAEELGLKIWDVRFLKEGSNWYLRIFVDKDAGITIDDCERMSKAIDGPLDELDPIKIPYCLEVSSPGINRELIRKEHFEKHIESNVIVRLIRPINRDEKELKGTLKSFADGAIILKMSDNNTITIQKKEIAFVKLNDFHI